MPQSLRGTFHGGPQKFKLQCSYETEINSKLPRPNEILHSKMQLQSFIRIQNCSFLHSIIAYGGVVWGAIAPSPLFSKDGPRDSFKIEEKIAGYRFGKIFPRNGRLILRN